MESTSSSRPGVKRPPMCRTSQARTIRPTERGFQRRAAGSVAESGGSIWSVAWVTSGLWDSPSFAWRRGGFPWQSAVEGPGWMQVQWSVRDKGLAGGLFQKNLARPEQAVDVGAALERDEQNFTFTASPLGGEFCGGEKEGLRVWEG